MAAGFRSNIFDPILITAQIVAMQCCYYIFLGLWLLLADTIGGINTSLEQIFDYRVSEIMCRRFDVRIILVVGYRCMQRKQGSDFAVSYVVGKYSLFMHTP